MSSKLAPALERSERDKGKRADTEKALVDLLNDGDAMVQERCV